MSFTILNDLESNPSRPISSPGGRSSPFRGKGFREDRHRRKSRPVSCPESPRNSVYSKSHRPSVHFDKISIDTDDLSADHTHDPEMDIERNERSPARYPNRFESPSNAKSPMYPAVRQPFQRSLSSIQIPHDKKRPPINNPRSYHRGLLSVISTTKATQSRMPPRKLSISNPNLSDVHRNRIIGNFHVLDRNDSISSDQPSNFGIMLNVYGTPHKMTRTMNRISRPTNLSPIVGTPDKDSCNNNNDTSASDGNLSPPMKFTRRRSIDNSRSKLSARRNSVSPHKTPSPKKSPLKSARGVNGSAADNEQKGKISITGDNKQGTARKKAPTGTAETKTKKASPVKAKRTSTTPTKQPLGQSNQNGDIAGRDGSKSDIKPTKDSTKPKQTAKLLKNQSDPSLAKLLNKKNSFKKRRTSSESDGLPTKDGPPILDSMELKAAQHAVVDKVENIAADKISIAINDSNGKSANNAANSKDESNGKKLNNNDNKGDASNEKVSDGNSKTNNKTNSDNSNNEEKQPAQSKTDDKTTESNDGNKDSKIANSNNASGKVDADSSKAKSNGTPNIDTEKANKPNTTDAKIVKKVSANNLVGGETVPTIPKDVKAHSEVAENVSIGTTSDAPDNVMSLASSDQTQDNIEKADITSIPTEASVIDLSIDNQEKFPDMLLKANDNNVPHKHGANHVNQGMNDADNIDSHAENLLDDKT